MLLTGGIACGDYAVALPNGYRLHRVHNKAVLIARPDSGGVVIAANVDRYAVVRNIVVGHVSQAEHEFERSLSVPGYFLLDTSTGKVTQGLDVETWRARLKQVGIPEVPSLAAPSRWD